MLAVYVVMKGTVGGGGGFRLLDARFIGTPVANPTNTYTVSTVTIPRDRRTLSRAVFNAKVIFRTTCTNTVSCQGSVIFVT